MSYKRLIVVFLLITICVSPIFSDVPLPNSRKPDAPYFMEPMNFMTVQLKIFAGDVSGMVIDDYADLSWNPAFLSRLNCRSVYLDMNFYGARQINTPVYGPEYYGDSYSVIPRWHQNTYMTGVQTSPLYNLAVLLPINSRLKIAVTSRSIFDYGPFRQAYYWDYYGRMSNLAYFDSDVFEDLEPQRLEVDDNQQIARGTQTELSTAYQLTKRLDLGVRVGQYIYRRDGDLYDSKWGIYPHSEFADLSDEELDITGNHYNLGIGLLYHPTEKTCFGAYFEMMTGKSDETTASLDTSYSWSERDTDPSYYNIYKYNLDSDKSYETNGSRPTLTLTFEKHLSENVTFRSFFKHSQCNTDIAFATAAEDTSFSDRTYDRYKSGSSYFQRRESFGAHRQHYQGDGTEKESIWKWFASLIYTTENDWSLFGGIQINNRKYDYTIKETSDYYRYSYDIFSYYDEHTEKYHYNHAKYYEYTSVSEQYNLFIPIGIKAKVVKGFYVILGGELQYYLHDEKQKGQLLYPEVITKKWYNTTVTVNDKETDRYEEYSSDPAKNFSRATSVNLGIVYKHSSGANLYIRSNGNILETYGWDLGFEFQW